MGPNFIAFAIPLFFIAIGLELWAARRRGRRVYRFADAVADMGCGIIQQTGGLFVAAVQLAGYAFFFERYRLVDFKVSSPVPWIIAFLGVDLAYYWWHRLSHRVNFMWAVHVVHHQSEDYNLAVALRQAVLSTTTTWPFYLPLAFLGIPPVVMAACGSLNTLYQFWIHTELVGKLGGLESVINTPSHHRVHHAINPRYLDKNFAGVFIFWDRLFGSFEEEKEAPVYGITAPLRSFNPFWAQVDGWVALARQARRTPRLSDKLRVWLAPPEWHPPGVEVSSPPPASPAAQRKYDPQAPSAVRWYVCANFVLESAAIFLLLLWRNALPLPILAASALLLTLSLVCGSGLLERRRWAPALELSRLALLAAFGLAALPGSPLRYAILAAVVTLAVGARAALRSWRTFELAAVSH